MTPLWTAAFAALWAFSVLTFLIVLGGLRRIAPVLEHAERQLATASTAAAGGLAPGTPAPVFTARTRDGAVFDSAEVDRTVMLFLSGSCQPCRALSQDFVRYPTSAWADELVVVLDRESELDQLGLPDGVRVIYQEDRSIAKAFGTGTTPHAFVVVDGIIIARGTPSSMDALVSLRDQSMEGGDLATTATAA